MRDVLIILNPRSIDECIQSYRELPIDLLWVSNMTEPEVEAHWGEVLDMIGGYDRALIISDDAIARRPALDAVTKLLDQGTVATGYSNLDMTHTRVNLSHVPLPDLPNPEHLDTYLTLNEAMSWPSERIPTTICSFSLTGMPLELWRRFPFVAEYGADFNLSRRLKAAGIPMFAAREALCWHVKEMFGQRDTSERKRLLIGERDPIIVLEVR